MFNRRPLCVAKPQDTEKVRTDLLGFINEMGKNIPEGGHNAGQGMEVESVVLKSHPACSREEAEGKEAKGR